MRNKFFLVKFFVLGSLLLVSCEETQNTGDVSISPLQQRIDLLTEGEWFVDKVSYDNVDVTRDFNDFSLKFNSDFTWDASNGNIVFLNSGNWFLNEDNVNELIMDSERIEISVSSEGELLVMIFELSGNAIGNARGLDGRYVFEFSKL